METTFYLAIRAHRALSRNNGTSYYHLLFYRRVALTSHAFYMYFTMYVAINVHRNPTGTKSGGKKAVLNRALIITVVYINSNRYLCYDNALTRHCCCVYCGQATTLSQKGSLVFDLMLLHSVSFPQLDFKQSALSTVGATKGKNNGANWALLFLAALVCMHVCMHACILID